MTDELTRLLELVFPELRARASKGALYVRRLIDGEPIGRLASELVRASAPTLPPPGEAEPPAEGEPPRRPTPVPPTLPDPGRPPRRGPA